MADPRTVNRGIIVPLTGTDVGTWADVAVNPNMVSLDGELGGVVNIAVSNTNILLTSPAGFAPTPGPGPTQAENAVLRFTGVLTVSLSVTLPLPGFYIIDNRTTGSFVLILRAPGGGEVIGVDQGDIQHVYSDGTNVRFVNLGRIGSLLMFANFATGLPGWVNACTVPPYLLCNGALYFVATYPRLGRILGATFGGDGVTTFAVPDLYGRFPLAYDGTGGRVTVGGSGLNGQALGAALDAQTVTLTQGQIPSHYHAAGIFDPTHTHPIAGFATSGWRVYGNFQSFTSGGAIAGIQLNNGTDGSVAIGAAATGVRVNSSNGLDTTYSAGGGGAHNNIPNALVTGAWAIRAG